MMAKPSSISASLGSGKTAKKAKKAPLSAAERAFNKLKADHRSAIRSSFTQSGFHRVTGVSDREFTYENQKTDLDDIFVYENVIVLAEYTAAQPSGVGEHLKNKKHIYDKIIADPEKFLNFIASKFPASAEQFASGYHDQQKILKIIYCSRHDFEEKYKENVPGPIYMDYPAVRYFPPLRTRCEGQRDLNCFTFCASTTSSSA